MAIRVKNLLLSLAFSATLSGQHDPQMHAEKPVTLYPGLGTWRHPIATTSPDAQKFFDQGLVLMYGFNRYEAIRSFSKAAALDPSAAMAYWGIAMSTGPYLNMEMDSTYNMKQSCEAVKKGLAAKDLHATDRSWLEAAGVRCPDFSDPNRYVAAMRALAEQHPDDPDIQTLYAEALLVRVRWRWYDSRGQAAEGVHEAEHVLESVMRRYPAHPGANHLYIHAVESSPTPERAIASAERLMGLTPAAGHMVHMPGHIWLALGDFNNAVAVNERGAQVDRDYFQETGVIGSYYLYYLHNISFLIYANAMQGRIGATKAAADQMTTAIEPISKMMPEMASAFGAFVTTAKLRLGLWDELLSSPRPHKDAPVEGALWHYSRAMAFVGKGDLQSGRRERDEFETARAKVDRNGFWGNNKVGDVMDLASTILEARTEATPAGAVPKWKRAVELQDSLVYDEPPGWYYPVRESFGAALLLSGDAAGSEVVFRDGLKRSPRNGRMLFGLIESLKAQKKETALSWVQREFDNVWKSADLQPRLQDL